MNDGRFISNYVRSNVFDQYIRNVNNIQSAQDYKHFLQNNGDQIINNLKGYLRENNTCRIEGKCLPMSGPNNNTLDYLKSNNRIQNTFLNQISENQEFDIPDSKPFDSNFSNSAPISNISAEQMTKDMYSKMVYEQQQKNISSMNNINY
jgi:hypothetical protein